MAAKSEPRLSPAEQAKLFSALSDPLRIRLLDQLPPGQERTGSDLAAELSISLALLCHHSKILVDAGLVEKRKAAQTTFYRATRDSLTRALRQLSAK